MKWLVGSFALYTLMTGRFDAYARLAKEYALASESPYNEYGLKGILSTKVEKGSAMDKFLGYLNSITPGFKP